MFLSCIHLQTVLVIVASFFLGTVEGLTINVSTPNVVGAQRGKHIYRSCQVTELPVNTYIEWIYYPNWMTNGILIYSTYNGINNDPNNFNIHHMTLNDETHILMLVIKTAKPEWATQFICRLAPNPGFAKTVNVVVLDPVECPSSIVEYDVGNTTNLSCSVNYYESTLMYAPNIMWYRDGQPVPGQITIDEGNNRKTARLIKSVTLADDDQKFVCIVDFMDSNPDYTDNCSTTFYVRHAPSEISFYPPSNAYTPNSVAVGDVINCTANGKPAPSIIWIDNAGNLLSDWGELFVTEEMRYWEQPIIAHCRANNIVTIEPVYGIYMFNVAEATSTVYPSETVVETTSTVSPSYAGKKTIRERERQTDRQTQRQTERERNRDRERDRDVSEVSFDPPSSDDAPTTFAVGDVIQCIANGRPDPTIEWEDLNGNILSGWRELVVTVDMRTWGQPVLIHCTARNTIDSGETFAYRGNYMFYVAKSSGTGAWVIAVAVIVPTVVLTAIAIATLFIIRLREMKNESATKTTTASTAALLFHY